MPSQPSSSPTKENTTQNAMRFIEHRVERGQGKIYVRDYPGTGPAFVLMHGFPDNLHIYDDLVPHLVAAGRRVVTFDFLGFGASDKPAGATYSFAQQLGDLEAVVAALALGKLVPVAHDASGPAALNFAIAHPDRVASVCMLNSAFAEGLEARWPEFIELFAHPHLRALALAVAGKPEVFGWILDWQRTMLRDGLPDDRQKAHFDDFMGPLIADNFIAAPSSAPAFVQMAAQFFGELARNQGRLASVEVPVKLIWGDADEYLTVAMAEARRAELKHATLSVVHAGHWLQSDRPEEVAREMLS